MGDTMPDNTCETSEWLQSTQIPRLNVPNTAPEAICKAPAKIPRMAVFDIRAEYGFTKDEFDIVIDPDYVQTDSAGAPPGTGDTEECVENSDTSTDSFTWVDWLTPVSTLADGRLWVLDGEELDCTETGDLSDDPDFKRPALPMASFNVVLPVPLTPPVTYDPDNGGVAGGGGGDGGGGGGGDITLSAGTCIGLNEFAGGVMISVDTCCVSNALQFKSSDNSINTKKTSGDGGDGCAWDFTINWETLCAHVSDSDSIVFSCSGSGTNKKLTAELGADSISSPYESITIKPVAGTINGGVSGFLVDVDWSHIIIDDRLAPLLKIDVVTTAGSAIITMADGADGIVYVKEGFIEFIPIQPSAVLTTNAAGEPTWLAAQPNSVLGVDENGNFTWLQYSDCEAACQTDEGGSGGSGAA